MDTYLQIQGRFTKRAESCILIGRADIGGVPTWGWGHTGPEVRCGQTITQEQADIDFTRDQAHADAELRKRVTPAAFAELGEHQKAALLDFVFNAGAGPLEGAKDEWTIWRDLNAGNLADVPTQLMRFTHIHVGGQVETSTGLKNRRTAEVVLWNTADVDASVATATAGGNTVSSGSVRVLPTPPEPVAPKPLAKSSLSMKVGTVAAGAGAWVVQAIPQAQDMLGKAHDLAAEHTDNHYVAAMASTLSAIVVVFGITALFIHEFQQKAAKV